MAGTMSASTARQSLVRATEDGERRWFFGGGLHIWKATSDDTDGAFLLFEDRMGHGKVTPLHRHPDSDETMIVLDGEILMHLDGEQHTVRAGGIASAPRGIPHAFKVSGADGARLAASRGGSATSDEGDHDTGGGPKFSLSRGRRSSLFPGGVANSDLRIA
jgi:mannose-6-phosphate isomerase-like protein (cupin superfamily)